MAQEEVGSFPRLRRRPIALKCPVCGATAPTAVAKIPWTSGKTGLWLFILAVVVIPCFFIPRRHRDRVHYCGACGVRIGVFGEGEFRRELWIPEHSSGPSEPFKMLSPLPPPLSASGLPRGSYPKNPELFDFQPDSGEIAKGDDAQKKYDTGKDYSALIQPPDHTTKEERMPAQNNVILYYGDQLIGSVTSHIGSNTYAQTIRFRDKTYVLDNMVQKRDATKRTFQTASGWVQWDALSGIYMDKGTMIDVYGRVCAKVSFAKRGTCVAIDKEILTEEETAHEIILTALARHMADVKWCRQTIAAANAS